MFFGLDFEKVLLIGVVAVMIIGPQKLPAVAQMLARFVARARDWTRDAKVRIKEEMGDDFDATEWRKLDPRQYDPRRIIREALLDDAPVTAPATETGAVAPPAPPVSPKVPLEPLAGRPPAPATNPPPMPVEPAPPAAPVPRADGHEDAA